LYKNLFNPHKKSILMVHKYQKHVCFYKNAPFSAVH